MADYTLTAESGSFTIAEGDTSFLLHRGCFIFGGGGIRFHGSGIVDVTRGLGGIRFSGSGIVSPSKRGAGGIKFSGSGVVSVRYGVGGIQFSGSGVTTPLIELTGKGGVTFSGTGIVKALKGFGGLVYSSAEQVPAYFKAIGSGGVTLHGAGAVEGTVFTGSGGIKFSANWQDNLAERFSLVGSGGIYFEGQGGKIFIAPPAFELIGSGGITFSYATSAIIRQAWAFNARFQASIFGDFNFIDLCRYKGKLYGILSDGLYLIEGAASNENGILLERMDFGHSGEKRIRSVLLGQVYNSNTQIKASVDGGSEHTASYGRGRYFLQRTMKGREFDLKVKNVSSGFGKASLAIIPK